MALLFATDGDLVDVAANSVLDIGDTVTILMWFRLNDNTQRMTLWSRDGTAGHGGTGYFVIDHRADLAGDYFGASRQRATSQAASQVDAANFSAYGLNKWLFHATVFDLNGTGGAQKQLMGDLSTTAAEPSSYTSQGQGTGAASTSFGTSPFRIGNSQANTAREARGDFAWVGIWNVALTDQQIRAQQFRPRVTSGCVLFVPIYTTGTQTDYSGNALSGSVTGATASGVQVPIKL